MCKALLTPIIAVVAIYIAWQQYKTNQQRLEWEQHQDQQRVKWELYERRFRVYDEVKKILSIIIRNANVTDEKLRNFYGAVAEADFLFGPEIQKYIDEIYDHACDLQCWNDQYRDCTQPRPEGYDHQEVVAGRRKERKWFLAQIKPNFEPVKEKFRKYLNIAD